MPKPAALILAPLPDFLLAPLREHCDCHEYHAAADKEAFLSEIAANVRVVIGAGGTNYDAALLERLPGLGIIAVFGVGYDGVPLDYCRARGIRVTNTPDVLTDDVADIAIALVLMTSRKLVAANRYLHAGSWQRAQFGLAGSLRGKTAGILGLGRIGKAIAHRLTAFGMSIAYHGRRVQTGVDYFYCESLHDLATRSDFLILSCPGGADTRHLIGESVLAALGPGGALINIARGSIVDETALATALTSGTIQAAGLDVFEHEPQISPALLEAPNTVLLPHVGSATRETRRAMAALVVKNTAAFLNGAPLITPVC
jgi:lactate dehydrogenase-like 2-hydroxyacid dehydrogenase